MSEDLPASGPSNLDDSTKYQVSTHPLPGVTTITFCRSPQQNQLRRLISPKIFRMIEQRNKFIIYTHL